MSDGHYSERDLLRELFPETAQVIYGKAGSPKPGTLGLYTVADTKLALVYGAQLAEFTPVPPRGTSALHCDLCHYTRSRSEAAFYRVQVSPTLTRYVSLCLETEHCQRRAGKSGLKAFAERIFPIEQGYVE